MIGGALIALAASFPLASHPLVTQSVVLPGGIRVIVTEDHTTQSVVLNVVVSGGAGEDPPGREGLAHLIEHLAFEGSAQAPGNAYDTLLAAVGGTSTAWTDLDAMSFTCRAPAEALPLLLFLESDRLRGLLPTEESLVNQRAVLTREAAGTAGIPARRALAEGLWPVGHPYRHTVLGDLDALATLSLAEVQQHVTRLFHPSNLSIAVVGNFVAADVVRQMQQWFSVSQAGLDVSSVSSVSKVSKVSNASAPSEEGAPRWVVEDGESLRVQLGWRTFGQESADRHALDLAARILHARRDGRGGVEARAWFGRWGGSFTVAARGFRAAEPARRWLERAIATLAEEGPTQVEIDRARGAMRLADLRALETLAGRALALNMCQIRTGNPDCLPEEWIRREEVKVEDVRRVVGEWLRPEGAVQVVSGPAPRSPAVRAPFSPWAERR